MTFTLASDTAVTPVDAAGAQRAYELDRKHVFHSWSAQDLITPMVISAAQGSYVWDGEGNKLLDFSSQLVNTNIGHQHPRVTAAIAAQAANLCTIAPSYVNDARSEAARLIAERTPGELDKMFFTNGGADANEHAVRMARLHTGRHKVLSAYRSYHGGTELAVNITGDPRRWPSDTGTSGTIHFFPPYLYRSAFHSSTEEEESERALEHLEQVIRYEGPDTIAAIMLESIPGTAGIYLPPPGYLAGVRDLATRFGIVFIADEVMAGFGRSGKWFAVEHFDVVPDLLTFAKGVTSGYVPLGGVAISPEIAATFGKRVYPGGLTYSGHPLACAAAVATIGAMTDERMVESAASTGETTIGPALRDFAARHRSVGEVRGTGVFWAIELVKDKETREPLAAYGGSSPEMNQLVAEAKSRGLLVFANFNRIHVVPPCNISAHDARLGLAIVDGVLDIADGFAA
ncbi:MAG: aspartate aminotransferase family protein [Actinomycetota bacterium]|nr:aspartate aminotransferase family protein [Actinomycetota bacterium]